MPIFGGVEVQYFQITPMGVQRLKTGVLRGVGAAERRVLLDLAGLGGMAEIDELTVGGNVSPAVITTSLRRLVDLGLVTPVAPETPTASDSRTTR